MEKVAVLLATYNGQLYLRELLDSLKTQTYKDFVCYIHDDGSTDETVTIVREYCRKNPDIFKLVQGSSTGGAKKNFMYLLRTVGITHPYIMFCDQDDVWLPNKIQESVIEMKKIEINNNMPCLVYCDMKVVNDKLFTISNSFHEYNQLIINHLTLDRAIMKSYAAGCSMLINNSLAKAAAVKDDNNIIMHDWWTLIIACAIGSVRRISTPLLLYRQHQNNTLGAKKITVSHRIKEITKRILTFEQYGVTKRGLYVRIEQLAKCNQVVEMYSEYKELIDGAIDFRNMSKFERCKYVLKNQLYQNRWSKLWTCICA